MFIDSSVIVAILSDESDAPDLLRKIETGNGLTSALVILASAMRLSSKLEIDPVLVELRIQAFLIEAAVAVVPIDGGMASLAVKAFAEYGKGRGHPARLNMADCLSYACAKAKGVALLYKGSDFSHTDLAQA